MTGHRKLLAVAALGIAAGTRPAAAQAVRGVVVDSATRAPVFGAVVTTMDSAGRVGRRSLTNDQGAYYVTAPAQASRLRIVRLGFRPVDVPIPTQRDSATRIDVAMTRIPYQLQPVSVKSNGGCPRRSDRAAALALLEQARAGLLATVVARSEHPAQMKRLLIDRRMDGTSDRIARHRVRVETVPSTVMAFRAARSGAEFVTEGFAIDSAGGATFRAPDADVLLDDGFANGYCFHIMDRDRSRPNQVGLGFRAANHQRGRIDVDGALWIDTVARALVDIRFAYVGMDPQVSRFEPGGRVAFRTLPNGVVLIDRWMLRAVGIEQDTLNGASSTRARPVARGDGPLVIAESGGELARVAWPDGFTWVAELGTLSLKVTDARGAPRVGTTVRLDDTNYEATTDSLGHLEIVDLAPGPYSAHIADKRLEPIGLTLKTPLSFVAARNATNTLTVKAMTAEDFVGDLCRQDKKAAQFVPRVPVDTAAWVIGRLTLQNRSSVSGVSVFATHGDRVTEEDQHSIGWFDIGTDGLFVFCRLQRDTTVMLEFRFGHDMVIGTASRYLTDPLTVMALRLDIATGKPPQVPPR